MSRNADVKNVEIAILSNSRCATVAATERGDLGERCDDDELGPIKTGKPTVEAPTKEDPIYDITQALHDAKGHLLGSVGMDLVPQPDEPKAEVVERARQLLRELEAAIPAKAKLYEWATASNGS